MKSIHHALIALTCSTAIGGLLVSPAKAAGACSVATRDRSNLSVYESPDERLLINELRFGRKIDIKDSAKDSQGRAWVKVAGDYDGVYRQWGWVIRQYLECRQYEIIPIIDDHQRLSPVMEVAANSAMQTNQPTVVTLESEFNWCAGNYFMPNIRRCSEELERSGRATGQSVKTVWKLDCKESTVQETSRLVDRKSVNVVWGNWSKDTQRAFRVYSYACRQR
jgi:hypothetical protein